MVQFILTIIIFVVALIWVVWHLRKLLIDDVDICKYCELKKSCQKFGHFKEK
jgi:hypothetical protein